jgi:hypothetical protein
VSGSEQHHHLISRVIAVTERDAVRRQGWPDVGRKSSFLLSETRRQPFAKRSDHPPVQRIMKSSFFRALSFPNFDNNRTCTQKHSVVQSVLVDE